LSRQLFDFLGVQWIVYGKMILLKISENSALMSFFHMPYMV